MNIKGWMIGMMLGAVVWSGGANVLRERMIPVEDCPVVRLVSGAHIALPTFDARECVLRLGARRASATGHATFSATLEGADAMKSAVVVTTAEGFTARVQDLSTGNVFSFVRNREGLRVRESAARAPHRCVTKAPTPRLARAARQKRKAAYATTPENWFTRPKARWLARGETETNVVDILVAFDQSSARWVKEESEEGDINAFAAAGVEKMNAALANTGLDALFRFRLVGTVEIAVNVQSRAFISTYEGEQMIDYDVILNQATEGTGAAWKALRAAREAASADIVSLLVDNGEFSGVGMVGLGFALDPEMLELPDYFSDYTYNVCSIQDVALGHTMTHEVGHNLGAGHADRWQVNPLYIDAGPQLFNCSSAYYFTADIGWGDQRFFTIMGYNWDGYDDGEAIEAPYFSSPRHTFAWTEEQGGALVTHETGVAVGTEYRDNTWTLEQTFAIAANYRVHKQQLALDVPSGGGTVTGGGAYAAGTRVKLTAKPLAGYVFAGWYGAWNEATGAYSAPLAGEADYRTTPFTYVVGGENAVLYARFVRKDEAAASPMAIACTPCAEGYKAGQPLTALPLVVDALALPTVAVKNLPAGLKFDAKTGMIGGTPTKPGVYEATVTAKSAGQTLTGTVQLKVQNFVDPLLTKSAALPNGLADSYGPYVPGVTVDFTLPPAEGWAASGFPAGLKFDSKTGRISGIPTKPGTSTVTFKKTVKDAATGKSAPHTASATFVVADYPELPMAVTWDTQPGAPTVVENAASIKLTAGVAQRFTLAIKGLDGTPTTVAAKNLPAGLKLVKTPLKNEKNAVTNYAYTIEGVPAAASKVKNGAVVPSAVQLTASNKYKWTGKFAFAIEVVALPAWAQGSFEGFAAEITAAGAATNGVGAASLTVTAAGKISGKFMLYGTNWTIAATGYTALEEAAEEEQRRFRLMAVAKSGKVTRNVAFIVAPGWVTGEKNYLLAASATGEGEGVSLALRRNCWKDKLFTVVFPSAAQAVEGLAGVKVKVASSGKATWSGKLDDGTKVSASMSLFMCPDGIFRAWLIVPAGKNFGGFIAVEAF